MKGYIVKYSRGSYDDYSEYSVKVFLNKKKAKDYVSRFDKILDKLKEFYSNISFDDLMEDDDMSEKDYIMWYKGYNIKEVSYSWCEEIEII